MLKLKKYDKWYFKYLFNKLCRRCGLFKDKKTDFHKSRESISGCQTYCKDCKKLLAKRHYEANKEKVLSHKRVKKVTGII